MAERMQVDATSTGGGGVQPPSSGPSRPLDARTGEPGSFSEAVPRPRSPRSLLAAELLLSAHDHPAQFSLSHSFSLDPSPNAPAPNAPGAAPPNPHTSMTAAAHSANSPMRTASPSASSPGFGIAGSRTLAYTAGSALPPSPGAHLASQPQPPPGTFGAPSSGVGPVPVQRRKARSEGPGKQGWKQDEDQTIVRMVEVSGQKWSSIAAVLPGRTDDAVRNRYLRLQRKQEQGEKKGDMWTAEEDRRIREAVLHHGLKWHEIAAELPGRSANAVRATTATSAATTATSCDAPRRPPAADQVLGSPLPGAGQPLTSGSTAPNQLPPHPSPAATPPLTSCHPTPHQLLPTPHQLPPHPSPGAQPLPPMHLGAW